MRSDSKRTATASSYAPNEFLAADRKTVQGFEVDLFNEVAAKFGVKTEWEPAKFPSIIGGVNGSAPRHSSAVSSMGLWRRSRMRWS